MKFVIARDGSGDFDSIQAAVDAVPLDNRTETILEIREGVYEGRLIVHRDHVCLRGVGDPARVILTGIGSAKDLFPDGRERETFLSFTVLVTGDDVTLENLTIRNEAGDGRKVGQAVALYLAGDRDVCRGCRLEARQDTLFCGPTMPLVERDIAPRVSLAESVPAVNEPSETHGRAYFENCRIQGDIDFIFGSYRCWFEKCTLFMNARGGWYTAPNTPENQPWGFVFHGCLLTGECNPGEAKLGRPWRKYGRTVFLSCEMDEHVSPRGFEDWDETRVVTGRMGEWDTRGARADQSTRHPAQKRLTAEEAAGITPAAVLEGWVPA